MKHKARKIPVIINAIKELVQQSGYLYTLVSLLKSDLFFPPGEMADVDWYEKVSFQEFNLIIGLLVQKRLNTDLPSKEKISQQEKETRKLLKELHMSFNNPALQKLVDAAPGKGVKPKRADFDAFFGSGDIMSEAIFYDESGAYDFQFYDLASKRYAGDKEWMLKNVGIDIDTCILIAKKIRTISEAKVNLLLKYENEPFELFLQMLLGAFCIQPDDLSEFSKENVESFFKLFSIKTGDINKTFLHPADYNVIESHPFIELQPDRYFLPIAFSLAQSIYESPFFWVKDNDPYRDTFLNRRGSETEKQAQTLLIKVFGEKNVYRDIKIYNKDGKLITDIDLLITKGNKAIIIQAKSKKLTRLARKGNDKQLIKDFTEAVQSAYEQALLSRNAVLMKDNKLVDNNGKEVQLDVLINDAYILCLTTDIYHALSTQTRTFLKKTENDPFPIALSVFDLDILTFYLKDPYEFLYYLNQRVKYTNYFYISSEISGLAYHLRKKLFPIEAYDFAMVDHVWAQLIDANFPAASGYQEKTPAMERLNHTWKNEAFDELVEQVKDTRDPRATDAIFFLYNLAGDGADKVIELMQGMKSQEKIDKHHDFSLLFGKHGVSYVIQPDSEHFKEDILYITMAKKYKTKSDEWLGLGTRIGSKKLVEVILYNNQPWQRDDRLEEMTPMLLPHGTAVNPHKKLGRNDPCYCGSRIKYKKCCLNPRTSW